MYSPEEILLLVQKASKMAIDAEKDQPLKDWTNKIFGEKYREYKLPEYYPNYRKAVDNYEEILVHADKDVFPARLFARRAPNQTDQAAKWIYDNYQNVTQPVYLDFLNTTKRCTHDSNWAIEYSEEDGTYVSAGKTFQNYVEKEIKNYRSIESFFKSIMFDVKLKDAMGVIAIKPIYIPTVEVDGEVVISSTELVEPVPVYYTCKQVVSSPEVNYSLIELNEKSEVTHYNSKQKKGRVYEFYDDQNIWRAVQYGKYLDNTFELTLYYNHEWGRVPVERLKGMAQIQDGEIIYQSPFLFAVPSLNLKSQNATYLQASICKVVYPATVMLGDVCEFENEHGQCSDGFISWYEGVEGANPYRKSMRCPNCHGIGLTSRLGPLETLLLKPQIRGVNEEGENNSSQKPLEYVSPETHALEFLENNIALHEDKARKILHLHTSNTEVKGSDNMTATGMFIDQKATFAFIMPIAFQAFELYEFMLSGVGWMRYRENFKPPVVTYPQTFDIGTTEGILETIAYMTEHNMPSIIVQSEVYRYLKSVYYTERISSMIYRLILDTDRVLLLSREDIIIELSKGLVFDWEVVLHDSSINFINELLLENPKFFEQEFEDQKDQLIAKAQEKTNALNSASQIEVPGVETIVRENIRA